MGFEGIVTGKDIDFNRRAIEAKGTKALILSHKNGRDRIYERDSGLNQVLCKLAAKKGIEFRIDVGEFRDKSADSSERGKRIGRLVQNIMLFKKFKNTVKFFGFSSDFKGDVQALLRVLGMPTDMAKRAVI
jgi:RNase P/RNase MRP subunit p30